MKLIATGGTIDDVLWHRGLGTAALNDSRSGHLLDEWSLE